jgi:CBS domain-containing protein
VINVADILATKGSSAVFTIRDTAPLRKLVKEFFERKIGALIATDDAGHPVGIVSERDVIGPCHDGIDFDTVTVADIMTRDLVTVHAEDDVNVAMDLMIAKKIRHLPVMADDGFRGIITVRDLLHAMREADKEDVHALVNYLQSAVEKRTGSDAAE